MPLAKSRPLTSVLSTTSGNSVGDRRRDNVTGNEYIFLKGVANCAVGSLVCFDSGNSYAVSLADTTHVAEYLPLAVAIAAVDATHYGWFQLTGRVSVLAKASSTKQTLVYTSATAGYAGTSSTSQTLINRMMLDTAAGGTDGLTTAYIQYPSAN